MAPKPMNFADPETSLPPSEPSASRTPSAPPIDLSPHDLGNTNVPEDIRTSWGWLELGIFLVFGIFSFLVIYAVASIYLLTRYRMTPQQLQDFFSSNAAYTVLFEIAWSLCLLGFLILMIRVYHGQRFWLSIGWRKFPASSTNLTSMILLCIFGGTTLAFSVGFLSRLVETNAHVPMQDLFQSRTNVLWLMCYGILFAPFWEETLFRGFIYPVFARKWGIPAGVFLTGVLFGAMHAAQLWGGWGQIALLTFVGIALTWARARSGTVAASFLVHITYNTILFGVFFLGTQGLHHLPAAH
jgi:membrane protease YdiL (CAAX protease family)